MNGASDMQDIQDKPLTPVDQAAGNGKPYDEPVISAFLRQVERRPDATAIRYLGERFSYRRLAQLIDQFAASLAELGVEAGDKAMIYLPNCPQWVIAYFGIQRIGAVPVPISPIYTPVEIEYLINDSESETIVCQDTNFGYVRRVWPDTCLKRVIHTNYVDLLPLYKRVIGELFDKVPNGSVDKGKDVHSFKSLLKGGSSRPPIAEFNPRTHLAYILYTGGTTGLPKGCQCSHSGIVSMVNDTQEVTEGFITEGEDVVVYSAPLFHQFGQTMFFAIGLCRGNPTVLMPTPDVDATLDAIEQYKGTLFLGVPALYRMILENDRFDRYDLSSLRYCWSGGDVLPREVYNRWKEEVGVPIYQVYGATECGFTCLSPLDSEPVPGTIGRPIPSRAIKLVDPEGTDEVPPGETGELLVHSDTLPPGYWNKPQETAESFVEIDDRVWYRTKDYCRLGEDGLVYYVDRAADVIKYKGYRVSASEIESVLQSHPLVIGACVVGVPDPRVGERIKAIVVLKEDAKGVGSQELMGFCRGRLAAYKMPKYIEFRDMLPKSKVGKLLRREIRDEERRKTGD
ncbi:MAG: Long-chain-fatty-acid--CoA ligase [Actinobacteria bacterium ADurb.Bin444]|nr:MAG: Long-chain-fatty-acid--CoA ligase [Actinobacteria bacterium ADurb.Bin444]